MTMEQAKKVVRGITIGNTRIEGDIVITKWARDEYEIAGWPARLTRYEAAYLLTAGSEVPK